MKQFPLAASRRTESGKEANRKMRAAGTLPAVLYGEGKAAESLSLDMHEMHAVLRHATSQTVYVGLKVGDDEVRPAVLKELQRDTFGRKLIHADFQTVKPEQEITLDIPVNLHGTPAGVAEGGIVSQGIYTIALTGTIDAIPEELVVDISGMELNSNIHTSELPLPEGVVLGSGENILVASCSEPASAIEDGEGEEGEGEEDSEE